MNAQIARIAEQALRTSHAAERVVEKAPAASREKWLAGKLAAMGRVERHQQNAKTSFGLAAIGLVGATGVAIAGGPSTLGVAAFVASAASTGGAIFHLAAAKFNEIRQSVEADATQARQLTSAERTELLAETRKLTLDVWDETIDQLLQASIRPASVAQQEQPAKATKPSL